MRIVFSQHVLNDKIPRIKTWGWIVTKEKIRKTIRKPIWRGVSHFGQPTAMSLLDKEHILRVIYEED